MMSARLPIEANEETPIADRGPLDQRKAEGPALGYEADVSCRGIPGANVAFRPARSAVFKTPRQFGPRSRISGVAAHLEQPSLELAPLGARLGEARGDHDQRWNALTGALGRHVDHGPAGTAITARSISSGTSAMLR